MLYPSLLFPEIMDICRIKNLMMKHGFLLIILIHLVFFNGLSQKAYRVYLKDKGDADFRPEQFFDSKAIERRELQSIPWEETDKPVFQPYLAEIQAIADSTGCVSRWFNFIKVYISSDRQLDKITALPFVIGVELSEPVPMLVTENKSSYEPDDFFLLERQVRRMGSQYFEENGLDGKGIRIAIFDAGFPGVDQHEAFEEIKEEGRIIKTWDFTKKNENVYTGNSHGRQTFACVGGKYNGLKIGLATGAEFLLARTEVSGEPFSEEEWWLEAAEWADQNGADIINSSLGYTYQRYFTKNMDGKSSLVVKAANMAARKGILVVNSAGNEADSRWKYIITPADGDSVLAVGGIDPDEDYHIGFSSLGPTADKRLKPNVCAYGRVQTAGNVDLTVSEGTSFSSPLVAGFAACAWQSDRKLTNMELFHKIEESGHLFPYFDYAHGYGVPQASYFVYGMPEPVKTFDTIDLENSFKVIVRPGNFNYTDWLGNMNLLYYHIADNTGILTEYHVVKVIEKEVLTFNKSDFDKGNILRIHFRGYTREFKF